VAFEIAFLYISTLEEHFDHVCLAIRLFNDCDNVFIISRKLIFKKSATAHILANMVGTHLIFFWLNCLFLSISQLKLDVNYLKGCFISNIQ